MELFNEENVVFLRFHTLYLFSVMRTPRRFVLEPKPSHATRVLCKLLGNLRMIFMKLERGFFLLNRCLSPTQMLNRCYLQYKCQHYRH